MLYCGCNSYCIRKVISKKMKPLKYNYGAYGGKKDKTRTEVQLEL